MSRLYTWQAARALQRAGVPGIQHIVFVGDSHFQGTTTKAVSMPDQLADLLTAGGATCSKNSWWGVPSGFVSGVPTPYDPRLTITGTAALGGVSFGRQDVQLSSSGAKAAFVPVGNTDTYVQFYRQQTSGGSFNIDAGAGAIGGATSTVGTTGVLQSVTKTAALGANTWTATTTSASGVILDGGYAYDSTAAGFMIHNGGGSGYVASLYGSATNLDVVAALNPVLGFLDGPTNDAAAATATAAFQASLTTALNALPTGARVMVTAPPSRTSGGGGPISQAAQDKYCELMRRVAWLANAPILDTYVAMSGTGGWTKWNSMGFYLDDYHLGTVGKGYMASDAAALLLAV